ncbi:MAG: hypothetical protein WKF40_07655 [Thermoleophilaceae bacterium]
MKLVDDDGDEVGRGRGRRDRHQGAQHHEGLLEPRGGHRRVDQGRLVPLRRHGQDATRTGSSSSSTARRR